MTPRRRRTGVAVGAAVSASGLVAAAALMWRRRRRGALATGLPTRRAARTARLARMSARAASDLAVTRTRQLGVGEVERARLEDAFHLRTAEQVMSIMGEMKGALMKIGQLLSFIDTGLPEAYRQALAGLQADAPPMAFELVAETVTAELGAHPDVLFAEFTREPIAAASIGQVHGARMRDGTEVVVKVQYPGVDRAIRADLENADLLYSLLAMIYPNLDPKPVVDELRDRIGEELDYLNEAENQRLFADVYRGHPFIHVPEVLPEVSSRRVITMERASGLRWSEALAAPYDLRNRWAEVLYRFVFGSINRSRVFNGDPHPGNYLFHEDGTVTFLDFGCVKHFTDRDIAESVEMVRAVAEHDAATLRDKLVKFGFVRPDDDEDPERFLEWFQQWDQPVLTDEPFTYTAEFAEAAVKANFDPTSEWAPVMKRFNLPSDFVFLTRINLGLNSILAGLGATNRWRAIVMEWWEDAPPSTDLGRVDAAFRAEHPFPTQHPPSATRPDPTAAELSGSG